MQLLLVGPALALSLFAHRQGGVARGLSLTATVGLATWAVTSLHDRFLLSIAPVVALAWAWAAAQTLRWAWARMGASGRLSLAPSRTPLAVSLAVFLCALWGGVGVWIVASTSHWLCGNAVCSTTLDGRGPRHLLDRFGHKDWLRIYQLNLSWARWDMGGDVVGGWVGPSRYSDLIALGEDGGAIRTHLESFGSNALLTNDHPSEYRLAVSQSFLEQFAPCGSHRQTSLYVLRDALEAERRATDWPPAVCDVTLPPAGNGASSPPFPPSPER